MVRRRWALRGVLAGAVVIASASVVLHAGRTRRTQAVEAVTTQSAVDRGLAFLRGNRSDPSALVVLDYLWRKYGLDPGLAFERTFVGSRDTAEWRLWGRMVGDRSPVDEAWLGSWNTTPAIDEVVMRALYCDTFPLPSNYGDVLKRFVTRGDYALTHAALALKMVGDNACGLGPGEAIDLEERVRRGMLALIDRLPQDARYAELDVGYEALAFLEDFMGEARRDDRHVAKLLSEQQADGGWRPQGDQPSRPHPTVLAVWALLARMHPDARPTRFARR